MPLPNLTNETNGTIKTLTNRKHAVARARSWLARKPGRKSRMYLRRRRNEPERMQRCLRRSYICWQAKKHGKTEKHTPCIARGVRIMQRFFAIQSSCKRAILAFQTRSQTNPKIETAIHKRFWILNRLPNGLRYPLVGGTR